MLNLSITDYSEILPCLFPSSREVFQKSNIIQRIFVIANQNENTNISPQSYKPANLCLSGILKAQALEFRRHCR